MTKSSDVQLFARRNVARCMSRVWKQFAPSRRQVSFFFVVCLLFVVCCVFFVWCWRMTSSQGGTSHCSTMSFSIFQHKYWKILKGMAMSPLLEKSERFQTKTKNINENRQKLTIQPMSPHFWIKILIERKQLHKNINSFCKSVPKTNSTSPKYINEFEKLQKMTIFHDKLN